LKASVISTSGAGCGSPAFIQLFYNDEHAVTLGVRQINVKTSSGTTTTNYPFSSMPSNPGNATNPNVGATEAQGGTDASGRPMYPVLYVTDLSVPPGSTNPLAGDWQYGGTGIPPTGIFGTWKAAVKTIDQTKNPAAVTVTPDADPAVNNWNLGPGADPVPSGLQNEGYGAEARWDISSLNLIPGHRYRVYFMVHDGDQNQSGGDSGQANWYFTMPGTAPTPTPTATFTPTSTPTASPTPTATATATATPTATATATFTPTPTPTPTAPAASLAATGTASNGKTVTTGSFTLKANTTYLVFAFTESSSGDSATPSSSVSGLTFNTIGSGSLNYNTTDYEFGWWVNGGGSDVTGATITVTFVKTISKPAYLQVVQLSGNNTSAPIAQSAYASGNNTNPYTANLPAPPLAGTNDDVYFLTGGDDLGLSAPTGTPAVTNLFYAHGGGTAAGTYSTGTPSQNESFAGPNKHWGTIAVEIKSP
jgi:Predicted solute binding protein